MSHTAYIGEQLVRAVLPPRPEDGNKGTFGHVLAIVGSYGMAGAAMLCTEAVLRGGAGLVTAAVPESIYPMVTVAVPEAVCLPLGNEAAAQVTAALPGKAAIVAGCGMGVSAQAAALLQAVLERAEVPVVLDADGLNLLAAHTLQRETVSAPLCLTPHPGEMARLMGISIQQVQQDRERIAAECAARYNAVVVLKGHHTVVATPDGERLINSTGCAGMAVGGSGDVLAGLIAALIAQGMPVKDAAACGVYLHGAAGEAAAAKYSQHAMLPRDLLGELGTLFLRFE